jgi:hypothetical protein
VRVFIFIHLWRARRRRFTFQIGNRAHGHEADKSERRQGRVNKSECEHEQHTKLHCSRTYVPAFAFAPEARAAFYTDTHNFIYDAELGGGEWKAEDIHRRTSAASAFRCAAHLSGLFAKRFMISNSDMAAEQYKFYDYAREAANQAEAAAAAPVLMMRRFRLISRPGFRSKMPGLKNMQSRQMAIILVLCKCRGDACSSALEKSIPRGTF